VTTAYSTEIKKDHVANILGWKSSIVLNICLPIFFTFIAYAAILFVEVALKKRLLTEKPAGGGATTSKYSDPEGISANPNPQPADANRDPRAPAMPTSSVNNPPTTIPLAVSKTEPTQPYLWEELFVHMLFHIMACSFAIHRTKKASNHSALPIIIAWIHFLTIIGYSFVSVAFSDPDQADRSRENLHSVRLPRAQLDSHHLCTCLIILIGDRYFCENK
jgi:hypothetical protein